MKGIRPAHLSRGLAPLLIAGLLTSGCAEDWTTSTAARGSDGVSSAGSVDEDPAPWRDAAADAGTDASESTPWYPSDSVPESTPRKIWEYGTETSPGWSCSYSPTYDWDWHDDVICTNGTDSERPYLRPGDDFVTEAEIMQSAREYEQQLNGR